MKIPLVFVVGFAGCIGCGCSSQAEDAALPSGQVHGEPVKMQQRSIESHGHRGARGWRPENTIVGFEWALKQGVDVLEMDVCISKDGVVVVSHEPWMNPEICSLPGGAEDLAIERGKFNLFQMTVEEIQQVDCGGKGHPKFPNQRAVPASKPTLREVIEFSEGIASELDKEVKYNVEVKHRDDWEGVFCPSADVFVGLVLNDLNYCGVRSRSCIQSFSARVLEEVHIQAPEMSTAWLIDSMGSITQQLGRLSFQPSIYSPNWQLLQPVDVDVLHARGIRVIPWTVNDSSAMDALMAMGVDGIITDYPDLLENRIQSRRDEHESIFFHERSSPNR
jgi:glycerophosphoryl diester phosphodiesterase